MICPACEGAKEFYDEYAHPSMVGFRSRWDCYLCDGVGTLDLDSPACYECDGQGYTPPVYGHCAMPDVDSSQRYHVCEVCQ